MLILILKFTQISLISEQFQTFCFSNLKATPRKGHDGLMVIHLTYIQVVAGLILRAI